MKQCGNHIMKNININKIFNDWDEIEKEELELKIGNIISIKRCDYTTNGIYNLKFNSIPPIKGKISEIKINEELFKLNEFDDIYFRINDNLEIIKIE